MTNREAIDVLKVLKAVCEETFGEGEVEALQMAIKSLEQHEVTADTDTVSRQAAIELVKDVCDAIMSGCESRYDPETEDEVYTDIREVDAILKCNKEVRIALRNMPSAQTEPQWIPVAERLPENKQEVLVTEYGDTDIGRRFDGRWLDRYGDKMKDVTAWMPKPEPYKEGGAV